MGEVKKPRSKIRDLGEIVTMDNLVSRIRWPQAEGTLSDGEKK